MFFQITDAVVVARQLGAKLVLPDIRGSQPGEKRLVLNFPLKTTKGHIFEEAYEEKNSIRKK